MRLEKPLLKIAAVLSAASLIAGFVSYRAGAFDRVFASEMRVESAQTPEQQADGNKESNPYLMSGSKSDRVVKPESETPAAGSPQLPAYIGGSKSLAPLIPPGKAAPPPPAPNPPPSQVQQPSR
jgi:hypothetical protein